MLDATNNLIILPWFQGCFDKIAGMHNKGGFVIVDKFHAWMNVQKRQPWKQVELCWGEKNTLHKLWWAYVLVAPC